MDYLQDEMDSYGKDHIISTILQFQGEEKWDKNLSQWENVAIQV